MDIQKVADSLAKGVGAAKAEYIRVREAFRAEPEPIKVSDTQIRVSFDELLKRGTSHIQFRDKVYRVTVIETAEKPKR